MIREAAIKLLAKIAVLDDDDCSVARLTATDEYRNLVIACDASSGATEGKWPDPEPCEHPLIYRKGWPLKHGDNTFCTVCGFFPLPYQDKPSPASAAPGPRRWVLHVEDNWTDICGEPVGSYCDECFREKVNGVKAAKRVPVLAEADVEEILKNRSACHDMDEEALQFYRSHHPDCKAERQAAQAEIASLQRSVAAWQDKGAADREALERVRALLKDGHLRYESQWVSALNDAIAPQPKRKP